MAIGADAYFVHPAPVWGHRMDFVFDAALPESCAPRRFEQLVGRQVGDTEFELCCIPLLLYDVSLGDIIATDTDYLMERVVKPSGRYTFRVWFGDDGAGPTDEITAELERLGALLEPYSAKLLAVDAADAELAQAVANYLHDRENAGQLVYETGRTTPG
jgi:hypothetical protein